MSKRLASTQSRKDRSCRNTYDNFTDTSDDSSSDSTADCELRTPAKKRYKRSIHHGMNKNRAFHHNASPEKQNMYFESQKLQHSYMSKPAPLESHEDVKSTDSCSRPVSLSSPDGRPTDTDSSSFLEEFSEDLVSSDFTDSCEGSFSASSNSTGNDVFESDSDKDFDGMENKPLYTGCNLTKSQAHLLIMLYVMKNSICRTGFTDLLHLISAFLPSGVSLTTSPYKIKEALKNNSGFVKPSIHCYCEECERPLVAGSTCENVTCQRSNAQVMQFHDLRMLDQLKLLFQDENFLNFVTKQKEKPPGYQNLTDIVDGERYKESLQKRCGSADVNLTFTMNTDGVTLFSSSKNGNLWPVYIAINELPVHLRFSRKYLLPCYLHCQVEKPNMATYLAPMMQLLDDLYTRGFEVLTAQGTLLVKAQLIAVSVDLPARALVANMKQFNGKTSCLMCLDDGESPPGNPLHRFFPYQENSEYRTHKLMMKDAKEAVIKNTAVHGVKGASPLVFLKYVDLPKVFVIDWMHCVLLGVTKALMCFWFKNQHRKKNYYVGYKMALLNKRLLGIKTPDYVSRRPRKLEEHGHWKATECREWLIHFSVPVLHGIMNPTPLVHHVLLVTAMSILTKDSITPEEVDLAELLLQDFCKVFPDIYGYQSQSMNVHLLKHMAAFTRLYGPLFAYSCFGFESMNSYLKGMFHGTRHINSQVGFAVAMTKQLTGMVRKLISTTESEEETRHLAIRLISKSMTDGRTGEGSVVPLGKKRPLQCGDIHQLLTEALKKSSPNSFMRLQKGETTYHSKAYQLAKTRNNFTVCFGEDIDRFGDIETFIEVNGEMFAAISEFKTVPYTPAVELLDYVQHNVLMPYCNSSELCSHMLKVVGSSKLLFQ